MDRGLFDRPPGGDRAGGKRRREIVLVTDEACGGQDCRSCHEAERFVRDTGARFGLRLPPGRPGRHEDLAAIGASATLAVRHLDCATLYGADGPPGEPPLLMVGDQVVLAGADWRDVAKVEQARRALVSALAD